MFKRLLLLTIFTISATFCSNGLSMADTIRIALVHLDARPGDVAGNRVLIETAINRAADNHANWIVTPELAESGYNFAKRIGTGWIEPFPNAWNLKLARLAASRGVTLLIGIAERDGLTGRLYNSIVVIGRDGVIHGTYRKHRVVNGPAENWANKGAENNLFYIDGVPLGLLICADAYKPEQAMRYRNMGAQILISPANWPPHESMGPRDYWERRSAESGLPLIVNNRTGREPELDFRDAESALLQGGRKRFSFKSEETAIFYLDWNRGSGEFSQWKQ